MMRRGFMLQTVLAVLVLGLIALGVSSTGMLRHNAQQTLGRMRALEEAGSAAESALEEATFRLRHAARGERPLDPAHALCAAVEPTETRALLAEAQISPRVTVGTVRLAQLGSLIDSGHGPAQGVLEMRVRADAGSVGLLSAGVSRELVRRYRFQVHRVRAPGGATGRVLWAQVRLDPEPLTQWVIP